MQFGQRDFFENHGAAGACIHLARLQLAFGQFGAVEGNALLVEDAHRVHHALLDGILIVETVESSAPLLRPKFRSLLQRLD